MSCGPVVEDRCFRWFQVLTKHMFIQHNRLVLLDWCFGIWCLVLPYRMHDQSIINLVLHLSIQFTFHKMDLKSEGLLQLTTSHLNSGGNVWVHPAAILIIWLECLGFSTVFIQRFINLVSFKSKFGWCVKKNSASGAVSTDIVIWPAGQ
jgi:hypothetical protein